MFSQNQYTDSRVIVNTQKSESSPVHRYQSHYMYRFHNDHQYPDVRVITSKRMSDIRIKTSTQIPGLSPIHRSQSHHQNTDIRVKTLQRCQIHDQYTDVRVATLTQLSESSLLNRYQSQHPSSTQMSESSPDTNNYREKQLSFPLHLAFSNIHYTYVHFELSKMHLIKRALNWELASPMTYVYCCWLLSEYWWWLWYLSTNIPLISVYWWWLTSVYCWWLWYLSTGRI